MTRLRLPCLVAVLATLLSAAPGAAQTVRGRVADGVATRPAAGVLVVLLDEAGAQRAAALTDSLGTFSLPAPSAGSWRLRVERVGRATIVDGPFALAGGAAREVAFTLRTVAIALDTIVARGRRGECRLRPAEGEQAQALWEEARKALNGTAWAQEQRASFVVQASTYQRDLDPGSLRVRTEKRERHTSPTLRVFTAVPVERLAREGYVRADRDGSSTYYAPDAEVLLSDAFLDTHCMVAQTGGGADSSLVGLAFRPARGRGAPDVQGVLWMDPASSELRFLEYHYVRLDPAIPAAGVGGRVEFDRLAGGEWMVRRWWVRTPVVVAFRAGRGMLYRRLRALRETGGEITSVARAGGATLRAHPGAAVSGAVFDSVHGRPLAGATVVLAGTEHQAVSDSAGRFRIADVPVGEYGATFHAAHLDSAGVVAPVAGVTVGDADVDGVALALPADGGTAAGRFFTRETIARLQPGRLTDLFRGLPGAEVDSAGIRLRATVEPPLAVDESEADAGAEAQGEASAVEGVPAPSRDRAPAGGCVPTIYRYGEPGTISFAELDAIPPGEVEVVAVYARRGATPEAYRRRRDCAVILVRLREPGA
ncbi:MAG TPA: carboxypeptidase regulatory-like domain-containing protein [Longimicrobiaceae bacterium]|nr:carboxypeptidase regulatory-like domain-containing protein [Longimicrobiaceae bacterium]